MNNYHLIRHAHEWELRREGAKRTLILFRNRATGRDFDMVMSATMTYAEDMEFLYIHGDDGRVIQTLSRQFLVLYEDNPPARTFLKPTKGEAHE